MQRAFLVIFFFFSINLVFSYPLIPDPEMTHGDLCTEDNPDFETHRYRENVPYCQRNVSWLRREKIYEKYNIPPHCRRRYTIDHFIPLALGGSNADINLWPEHILVKATRPQLEQELYIELEEGKIKQEEAIEIIVREKTKDQQIVINTKARGECD